MTPTGDFWLHFRTQLQQPFIISEDLMNHTILLRTRNRPEWIERTLGLYKEYDYKGTIYLLDDSEPAQFKQIEKLVKEFAEHLKIRHELGAGASLPSRIDRVRESTGPALMKIETEFFSVSCDDDFLFPEFISEGIDHLNKNADFEAVHGPEVKIHYDDAGNIYGWRPKPWVANRFNDPVDRLLDFVHTISLVYFGVCRTSSLRYFHEFEEEHGRILFSRKNSGFGWYDEEVPYVLYIHITGKVDYLKNVLMGVRGIHGSPTRIENFKFGNEFNEFTVGPIVRLANEHASSELQRSLDDLVKIVELVGSKYDDDYVKRVVYKVIWALLSGNRTRLVDRHSDYWNYRYGTNKLQKFQKKIMRTVGRKIAKLQAYKTIISKGRLARFQKTSQNLLEKNFKAKA